MHTTTNWFLFSYSILSFYFELVSLEMSSNDNTSKRRKVATNSNSNGGEDRTAEVAAGVEDDVIAKMIKVHMQNEKDSIRGRLLQMDELESKIASMQGEIGSLKDVNNFLKARCGSLERSVKILIQEQKWEYSAPDIPRSHWEERDFGEDYIQLMEDFLAHIKQATCDLRNGVLNNERIILGDSGDEEFETTLLHDDLLLPHWKELANALQLYQEEKPFKLSIFNLQLPASVIDLLAPVLKHESFDTINLQNNSFVNIREGVEFVVEVMKSNDMMEVFCWTSNIINSMEDARYLVDAIISHPSIDMIRLDHCFGGDGINGYDTLRSLLTSDNGFKHIDFDRNNIRTGGDTAISDYLATNPPLKVLHLDENKLNDEDARLIARALKCNTNLQYIYLDGNNITEVGCNALSKAVYNPESLNSVADCNHTCEIRGIAFGDIPVNLSRSNSNNNRRRKIYRLLSSRNREESNVYHLNLEFGNEDEDEDTLALVPNLLESVHRYAERVSTQLPQYEQPLSITYEILRGWKMPELYELR